MQKAFFQKLGLVNVSFMAFITLCSVGFIITSRNICIWLVWNAFLAWAAIFFIRTFIKYPRAWIFLILGVLFLPNAFYILTDFIHVNNLNFYQFYSYYNIIYTENLTPWIELFLITIGALFGWIVGLKSIKLIAEKFKSPLLIPIALSLLCGFGIWIGRFLRLNSWDIFRPIFLVEHVASKLSWFGVGFTLLFAVAIFASYLIFSQIKLHPICESPKNHKSPKSAPKSRA